MRRSGGAPDVPNAEKDNIENPMLLEATGVASNHGGVGFRGSHLSKTATMAASGGAAYGYSSATQTSWISSSYLVASFFHVAKV
jgi:hypothetical protein